MAQSPINMVWGTTKCIASNPESHPASCPSEPLMLMLGSTHLKALEPEAYCNACAQALHATPRAGLKATFQTLVNSLIHQHLAAWTAVRGLWTSSETHLVFDMEHGMDPEFEPLTSACLLICFFKRGRLAWIQCILASSLMGIQAFAL